MWMKNMTNLKETVLAIKDFTSSKLFYLKIGVYQLCKNHEWNFCFLSKCSNRHWIYLPAWNNQISEGTWKTLVLKTLDINQQRTVIPDRWETKWAHSQVTCMGEFAGHGTERENLGKVLKIPWIKAILLRV